LNAGKCVAQKSTDLLRVGHRTGPALPELVNFSQPESAQNFLCKVRLIKIRFSIAIVIAPNIFQARSGKKISGRVCSKALQARSGCKKLITCAIVNNGYFYDGDAISRFCVPADLFNISQPRSGKKFSSKVCSKIFAL